jgi:biotin synthase-related radical SAM superfamily protein
MRKKTEPQTQKHPKTSRAGASKKGLIVKEENLLRSAWEECALDDRSHRTTQLQARARTAPVQHLT